MRSWHTINHSVGWKEKKIDNFLTIAIDLDDSILADGQNARLAQKILANSGLGAPENYTTPEYRDLVTTCSSGS